MMNRSMLVHRRAALAVGSMALMTGMWGAATSALAQDAAARVAKPPTVAAKATGLATFAGGCFWCVEADFDKVPGVLSTTSGYIGGKQSTATYQQVSAGGTGHIEAVQIEFDPTRVTYRQLVDHFWKTVDPTVRDRQFCDVGVHYRTGIFTHDDEQMRAAQASKQDVEKTKPFKEPIVTEIVAAGTFYPAEGYHQDYYKKNPVRYAYYRNGCGRDARLEQLWGNKKP